MQRVDVEKKGSGKKRKQIKKEEKYDETVRGLLNERVSVRRSIDRMNDTICMSTDESVSPLIGVSFGIVALIFNSSSVELIILSSAFETLLSVYERISINVKLSCVELSFPLKSFNIFKVLP